MGTAAATASAAATITGATIMSVVAAVSTGAAAATISSAAAPTAATITGIVTAVSTGTAAATVPTATTISTHAPTVSDAVEYDSLSHRAQIIVLMDRNAYVKNMYDAVIRQQDAIIAEVVKEKPELEVLIRDVLDAPFCVQNHQQPGKMHCVEKLVDIWEVYKQVPTLRVGFLGGCVPQVYGCLRTRCANSTTWPKQQLPRIGTVCMVGSLSQYQMWNGCGCS
jgi:hypothetical protein